MTITDDELAAIIAAVQAPAPPTPAPVLPPTVAPEPARPLACAVCGEALDPTLAGRGAHLLCGPPPAPQPTPAAARAVPLDEEIRRVVGAANDGAARSQQRRIGPSEIGQECDRFIAYKLLDVDPVNVGRDNWLAILGTAMHAWLADAFEADNQRLGRTRWVIEQRVWLTDALSGSCDLYDADRRDVDDHKLLGVTSLRKIQKGGPPPKYRTQLHLYGYGHARAGRPVDTVNLLCYPRNDNLVGEFGGNRLHVWSEAYDERVALDALARLARLTELALGLDVDVHPDRWSLIPGFPDEDCRYCPFFAPGALSASDAGCPGHTANQPAIPTTIPGLV